MISTVIPINYYRAISYCNLIIIDARYWILRALLIFVLAFVNVPAAAQLKSVPAEIVKAMLTRPEVRLNYLDAATAFDRLILKEGADPVVDAMVARLVDAARQMAGPNPTDAYKLSAIRKVIYDAGLWNHNRAFSYDLADPLGQNPKSRLLTTYIRTRKGNCVSMPILFLIIADRMGLNVHLASAPLHLFVRYTKSREP